MPQDLTVVVKWLVGELRALKKDGDGMAVIEITYLSRNDAGQADIDSEFSTFRFYCEI
jgi:hypothetical protein